MSKPAVTVFATCLVEQLRPSIGRAVMSVLSSAGITARSARGATCCGQPAWNAGYVTEARRVARATLRVLARTTGPIVIPSGSCATMVHESWPRLFATTKYEEAASRVASRAQELSSYLADTAALRLESRENDTAIAYHDSCHMLRTLGIDEAPRRLLAAAGYQVEEVPGAERCCGFGGTFAVKMESVSVAMADDRLDDFASCGSTTVVSCDPSCLMHLEARARRRGLDLKFMHLAEVLDGG